MKNKIKDLKDIRVMRLKEHMFVTEKPVYMFCNIGDEDTTLLTDLPHGSLVYTGEILKDFPAIGFKSGVFMIWEGKEDSKIKPIIIRGGK